MAGINSAAYNFLNQFEKPAAADYERFCFLTKFKTVLVEREGIIISREISSSEGAE